MAEESQFDRTEPASQRRLDEARREGVVARSNELNIFAGLAVASVACLVFGGGMLHDLSMVLRRGLELSRNQAFDPASMAAQAESLVLAAAGALAPLAAALLLVALLAPLALGGWTLTSKPLIPDFSRLDPIAGLRRLVSLRALVELTKALAKAFLVGGVAVFVLWHQRWHLLGLSRQSIEPSLTHFGHIALLCLAWMAAAYAVIAAADVAYQLWSHARQLRMSKDEVRREARESDGDPQIKARIRAQQRTLARGRMMAAVPGADVVVTNPSHYAVALSYRDDKMRAPTVVAKGADRLAQTIRELAQANGVPLVEAPPLARALFRHSDVGDEIPAALYSVVAELLAYVYQLRRLGERRVPQPEFAVPAGLDRGAVA